MQGKSERINVLENIQFQTTAARLKASVCMHLSHGYQLAVGLQSEVIIMLILPVYIHDESIRDWKAVQKAELR